jgi:hypothetical protein
MNVSQLHPEEALDLYEAGRLGAREIGRSKRHLARCPSCAAHLQWRSDVQATLTESSGGAAEARRMAATALARRGIPAPGTPKVGPGAARASRGPRSSRSPWSRAPPRRSSGPPVERMVATPERARSTGAPVQPQAAGATPPGRPRRPRRRALARRRACGTSASCTRAPTSKTMVRRLFTRRTGAISLSGSLSQGGHSTEPLRSSQATTRACTCYASNVDAADREGHQSNRAGRIFRGAQPAAHVLAEVSTSTPPCHRA